MNSKFELLETDMIYEICEFLSENKKIEHFIDPYALDSEYEDIFIRNRCFNYSSLFFAKIVDSNIKEMCILNISQYPSELKMANINYVSSIDNEITDLIDYSIRSCKEIFNKFKLISINHDDSKDIFINSIVNELGFKESMYLQNELGINRNIVTYTKSL